MLLDQDEERGGSLWAELRAGAVSPASRSTFEVIERVLREGMADAWPAARDALRCILDGRSEDLAPVLRALVKEVRDILST